MYMLCFALQIRFTPQTPKQVPPTSTCKPAPSLSSGRGRGGLFRLLQRYHSGEIVRRSWADQLGCNVLCDPSDRSFPSCGSFPSKQQQAVVAQGARVVRILPIQAAAGGGGARGKGGKDPSHPSSSRRWWRKGQGVVRILPLLRR